MDFLGMLPFTHSHVVLGERAIHYRNIELHVIYVKLPCGTLRLTDFVQLINTFVNQSPTCWKLPSVIRLFDRIKHLHVVVPIFQGVIPTPHDTLLITWFLGTVGMIATQTVNVTRKRREPASKKYSTP